MLNKFFFNRYNKKRALDERCTMFNQDTETSDSDSEKIQANNRLDSPTPKVLLRYFFLLKIYFFKVIKDFKEILFLPPF